MKCFARMAIRALAIAAFLAITLILPAQQSSTAAVSPQPGPASRLYHELDNAGLDPVHVYRIRDTAIQREDLHLILEDGTIAFTQAVDGHVTGAIFEGTGEVLVMPPDRVERWSMDVFTGSAILEEKFVSAYLSFNDETFTDLEPALRATEDAQTFIAKWDSTARSLEHNTALRLLSTYVNGTKIGADGRTEFSRDPEDRFLFARVTGVRSGVFDMVYDTKAVEQIVVGRLSQVQGRSYYDLWTSFPSRSRRNAATAATGKRSRSETINTQTGAEAFARDPVRVTQYRLRVQISPPRTLDADATLDVTVSDAGIRVIFLELSRYLKVQEVSANGEAVEFIQNEALKGTELARRGNDAVAIVLPRTVDAGARLQLHMIYGGDVMADAGGGLMYVGPHGDWYPNRGLAMSNFDIEFHYPAGWTLVGTGRRVPESRSAVQKVASAAPEQVSRWVSERPMPFAGFNLGRYEKATAKAGDVLVEAYASHGVESTMRRQQTVMVIPGGRFGGAEETIVATAPSPADNAQRVANEGARTIDFYARRIGPYPYSSLALTQMPGTDSQSWPGLIYLSSYVFLSAEERSAARVNQFGNLAYQRLMEQHETAHQWWGDLLLWKSYREQWIVEALSNYCALLKLESEDPSKFRDIMNHYRQELLSKNTAGVEFTEAGPVTLGVRLNSSRFPNAYDTISYGRGTWLFHMLRHMLLTPGTAQSQSGNAAVRLGSPDEPFFRVLRRLRDRFEGREITTRDVQKAFEEELPAQLYYEHRKSLDWFFDGWVNGTSIPKFELTDVKFSSKTGTAIVTGKVLLKNATEGLVTSLPVYGTTSGTPTLLGRVFVEGAETPFRFPVPPGTKKIVLDPLQTVLSSP